jgi:AraC family transcriptional regulator
LRSDEKAAGGGAARLDYVEAVNRAIDHVVQGLDRPLRLEDVARVAGFSPFHFHRVFRSLVGETLRHFVKRVRLERALFLIAHDRGRSLTDVALSSGFSSSADFSRSFKQRYGVPPSAIDIDVMRAHGRERLQRVVETPDGRYSLERLPPGENPDGFEVLLRDLPARTVAYIRVLNPYASIDGVRGAAARLLAWAEERGLADGQWLGYQWEDPEIVPLEQCRYDIAVEVDPAALPREEGEIGRLDFPRMRVAQVEVRGDIELEMRALDWLFGTWLPASGHVPDEQPCFEAFIGKPFAHGLEHFELFAHLPVRRV